MWHVGAPSHVNKSINCSYSLSWLNSGACPVTLSRKFSLCAAKEGQCIIAWNSSPVWADPALLHSVQNLFWRGVYSLEYLPTSISSLCALILSAVKALLCICFGISSRYFSILKAGLIFLYNDNFPLGLYGSPSWDFQNLKFSSSQVQFIVSTTRGGYSSSSRAGRLGRTLWPQNSTSVAETEKGGQNSTMTSPPPQH